MSKAGDKNTAMEMLTEDRIFEAEEGFLFDVQYAIGALMKDKGITRKALADMLGVSGPRVTEMLSDEGSNLTLRTVGRIFAHLGETPEVACPGLVAVLAKAQAAAMTGLAPWPTVTEEANDNCVVSIYGQKTGRQYSGGQQRWGGATADGHNDILLSRTA